MRKTITIILGILLLTASFFLVKYMVASNKKVPVKSVKIVNSVYTETVKNSDVPIVLSASGNLVAKNKIELYSEVQGILVPLSKEFRVGTIFQKGETILKINNEEQLASLQAQKSQLYNTIASVMPDIRLDYPESFEKWQSYLDNFNFNNSVPALPDTGSDKEKLFISGRNIYTTYYNVKNLEVRLSKYQIRAPYSGVLTEALVNPGTLVRQGQKLGEFIDPSMYEMEIAINSNYKDLLQIGKTVSMHDLERSKNWIGKVIRVNGKIDQTTQTIKVYIELSGKELKEGMYLEADLDAKIVKGALEVPRKLLVNNENIYVVNDTILTLVPINIVHYNDQTAVVKGLPDGVKMLSKPVPGAYEGMVVMIMDTLKK